MKNIGVLSVLAAVLLGCIAVPPGPPGHFHPYGIPFPPPPPGGAAATPAPVVVPSQTQYPAPVQERCSKYDYKEATITGDALRVKVIAHLICCYYPNTKVHLVVSSNCGKYVQLRGPHCTEKIFFSDAIIANLRQWCCDPKADGILMLCPTQARQLFNAMGPLC